LGFFDPYLVLAVARVESNVNPDAVLTLITINEDGTRVDKSSYGLMQLLPSTARMLGFTGTIKELMKWETNLFYSITYLEQLAEKYDQCIPDMLAAYNAGSVFICKTGFVKATGKPCKKGRFTNQQYVDKILVEYKKIKIKYEYLPSILNGNNFT
jgi:soluble lytic murein transglycosylase-like protein